MERKDEVILIAKVLAYLAALKHKIPFPIQYADKVHEPFIGQASALLDALNEIK